MIENGAERIDIARRPVELELPEGLLRRHIRRRTEDVAVARVALGAGVGGDRIDDSGRLSDIRDIGYVGDAPPEAPIHNEHVAELADHDVIGLQIAVNDAAAVREPDGLANAGE